MIKQNKTSHAILDRNENRVSQRMEELDKSMLEHMLVDEPLKAKMNMYNYAIDRAYRPVISMELT